MTMKSPSYLSSFMFNIKIPGKHFKIFLFRIYLTTLFRYFVKKNLHKHDLIKAVVTQVRDVHVAH